MPSALSYIEKKLNRAMEHIQQLDGEIEAFLRDQPHREAVDYDAETAKAFQDFHRNREIPPRISIII